MVFRPRDVRLGVFVAGALIIAEALAAQSKPVLRIGGNRQAVVLVLTSAAQRTSELVAPPYAASADTVVLTDSPQLPTDLETVLGILIANRRARADTVGARLSRSISSARLQSQPQRWLPAEDRIRLQLLAERLRSRPRACQFRNMLSRCIAINLPAARGMQFIERSRSISIRPSP